MCIERNTLIWLNSLGIHSDIIERLTTYLGDITEIHNMDAIEIENLGLISKSIASKIVESDFKSHTERFMEKLGKEGIDVTTVIDDDYPYELKEIPERPLVLYRKGKLLPEDHIAMAIVGSRKATSYGKWATERFVRELSQMGVTIVSGMAVGIDTVAHRTALQIGGRTVGVLGNGIDNVYPKSNISLYNEASQNGALISEFPPGTPPLNFHFPMRNRIISGLSLGVVVIEAKKRSGSLITASHALEQGKDVFAIPGNINSLYSEGTNHLIKDGAKPLLDIDDILEEVKDLQILKQENKENQIEKMDLSDTEKKIMEFIKDGPIHSDIIVLKSGLTIQTVISTLTILELKGLIKEMSSRIFTLV